MTDDLNVAIYNDQPVQFTFLSMKDVTFSASDIRELKMVIISTIMCTAVAVLLLLVCIVFKTV